MAERFTSEGAVVIGVDQAERAVGEFVAQADLAGEPQVEAMYGQVVRSYGRLDAIYNNGAGNIARSVQMRVICDLCAVAVWRLGPPIIWRLVLAGSLRITQVGRGRRVEFRRASRGGSFRRPTLSIQLLAVRVRGRRRA